MQTPEELIRKLDHILSAEETTAEASMERAVAEIAVHDAEIAEAEREACAIIAEAVGATDIGESIRNRVRP